MFSRAAPWAVGPRAWHAGPVPLVDPRSGGGSDRVPSRLAPRRVLVAGTSGSGKTTLAARIAQRIGAPHVEIDALFHGPGWRQLPDFEDRVADFVAWPAWVTEWQYSQVRELLADRADLIVWLDLPRHVVMRQVIARTARRRLRREELWNGNVESSLWHAATDPEGIIRWAWETDHKTRPRMLDCARRRPLLPIVRCRTHAQVDAWLTAWLP